MRLERKSYAGCFQAVRNMSTFARQYQKNTVYDQPQKEKIQAAGARGKRPPVSAVCIIAVWNEVL